MKKVLVLFGVFALAFAMASSTVLAKSDEPREHLERLELPEVESFREHPASLFVGPHGQTRIIQGEIVSLSGTTTPAIDEVKVWGLVLKVDMTAATFIPAGTSKETLRVGDKVNIEGTIDQATGVISASTVHSISARRRVADDILSRITGLVEHLRRLQQKAGLPLTPLPTDPVTP